MRFQHIDRRLHHWRDRMMLKIPTWLRGSARLAAVAGPNAGIAWHGEQEGEAEQQLKSEWVQMFRLNPLIKRGYLARATLAEAEAPRVVLVLAAAVQPDAAWLVAATQLGDLALPASAPFAVVILGPKQCAPLERVCRPFYYSV
jgi:hypothetical protein